MYMAEYRVTYKDNGVIEKELDFKGETFRLTMIPDGTGSTSKEKTFDIQVVERLGEFDECVLDVIGNISFADEFEIEEYLEELSYYENVY